jgi:cytochrome oxidase Cu insertion factor (SCO1/SenC/PrrC family)
MPEGTRSIGKGDRKKEQSMVHKLMRAVIGGVILIQTGVVSAGVLSSASAQTMARAYGVARSTSLPVHGSVPDFSLIERSGRTVDRQALLGKV